MRDNRYHLFQDGRPLMFCQDWDIERLKRKAIELHKKRNRNYAIIDAEYGKPVWVLDREVLGDE